MSNWLVNSLGLNKGIHRMSTQKVSTTGRGITFLSVFHDIGKCESRTLIILDV